MRIFDHPNLSNFKCPICGTSDDKAVTLVGIAGTGRGWIMEAKQIHVDCIKLTIDSGLFLTTIHMEFRDPNVEVMPTDELIREGHLKEFKEFTEELIEEILLKAAEADDPEEDD